MLPPGILIIWKQGHSIALTCLSATQAIVQLIDSYERADT